LTKIDNNSEYTPFLVWILIPSENKNLRTLTLLFLAAAWTRVSPIEFLISREDEVLARKSMISTSPYFAASNNN